MVKASKTSHSAKDARPCFGNHALGKKLVWRTKKSHSRILEIYWWNIKWAHTTLKCYSICFSQMFLLKLIFSIKSKYLNTDLNLCPSLFSDRCFQLQTAIHFPRDTVTWTSQEHWEQCQPPLPRVQFLNLTIHTSEIIKKNKQNVASFCQPLLFKNNLKIYFRATKT